jgi:hypothetical protein
VIRQLRKSGICIIFALSLICPGVPVPAASAETQSPALLQKIEQMRGGALLLASVSPSPAFQFKTRYSTVRYEKDELLRKFNTKVSLGPISYTARYINNTSIEDQTRNKIDAIIEKTESILDMFPRDLHFNVVLLASEADVQNIFKVKYGKKSNFISFYSPGNKTVYLSVNDIRLGVLAHELAHVILDNYFDVPPPVKIHELLSQYVETHIED